jgi:hypothetical protein
VPSEPEDGKGCVAVVERPRLTATALGKGLQMVDDLVDNFFEVADFMDRYLKFKLKMEAVEAPYKDMLKNAKQ